MNIELSVLSKILHNKDIDNLLLLNKELFIDNKDIFVFIDDHYNKYNELPSIETIKKFFPDLEESLLDINLYPENTSYYIDLLRNRKKYYLFLEYKNYLDESLSKSPPVIDEEILNKLVTHLNLYTTSNKDLLSEKLLHTLKNDYLLRKERKGMLGFPYRWQKLNEITGGIQKYFITLTGKKKVGKTFILCCIINDLLLHNQKVLLFSMEMTSLEILRRIVSIKYSLPYSDYKNGILVSSLENKFFNLLENDNELKNCLIVNESSVGNLTPNIIRNRISFYKPDFVFIDGVYLLQDDEKSQNIVMKLYNITQKLKSISKENNVGIIVTTQQNETGETNWSRSFSQDSDLVILVKNVEVGNNINTSQRELEVLFIREGIPDSFRINFLPSNNSNFEELNESVIFS